MGREREDSKKGVWANQFYRSWGQMTPKPRARGVLVWSQKSWSPDLWPVLEEEESVRHSLLGRWLWRARTRKEESQMAEQQRGKGEQKNSSISGWKENIMVEESGAGAAA